MNKKAENIYAKFGANERDLINSIKISFFRTIAILLIGLKLKLQWSGWLQYVIPVPITLLIYLLSLIVFLFGLTTLSHVFFILGSLLMIKIVFDIITVKFMIRPSESKPKRQDIADVFSLMLSRHSCRSYQNRTLTKVDHQALIESVNKHLAEPKFSSENIRIEYISANIRVWPLVNGQEFLVAIAPKEYNRPSVMDVGRTLQKVVIDATRMGLGTCWVGPGADHKSIIPKLGNRFNPIKDNIICICAVGYESKFKPLFVSIFSKKMRSRMPIDALFFSDYKMNDSLDFKSEANLEYMQLFEACQWSPSSYNGQTTRGVVIQKNDQFKRIDFCSSTTSKYYAVVAAGIWCANWEMGCEELKINGHFESIQEEERLKVPKINPSNDLVYNISWVSN